MKKLGRNYSVNANNELMEQLLEFLDKENAKIVEKNIEKCAKTSTIDWD